MFFLREKRFRKPKTGCSGSGMALGKTVLCGKHVLGLLLLGLLVLAKQDELAELVGFDTRFQQGELVGNYKSLWISRQKRLRTIFIEMRTSVGSEYYLRHLRSSAFGTRLRAGPHSCGGSPKQKQQEDTLPSQYGSFMDSFCQTRLQAGPHSWRRFAFSRIIRKCEPGFLL